ncbi:hypothetical protein F1912_12140 [Akkermansia muciniphila]|nr:hypothetical protein F1912_12140 [Akkermansia muciniphila]
MKISVALPGGGMETGVVCAGVLSGLCKIGATLERVSATSFSSVAAVLFSTGAGRQEILSVFETIKRSKNAKNGRLTKLFREVSEGEKAYVTTITCADLLTQRIIIFDDTITIKTDELRSYPVEDLAKVLRGSVGLSSFVYPQKYKDMLLADSSVRIPGSAFILRFMGCEDIISVHVDLEEKTYIDSPLGRLGQLARSNAGREEHVGTCFDLVVDGGKAEDAALATLYDLGENAVLTSAREIYEAILF